MDLSRSLIVIIVFLVMWKEASNQEVNSEKDLTERIKRYHESDSISHTKRREQSKVGKEKKYTLTGPINTQTDLKTRHGSHVPGKKSNKVISPRQLVRIKPAQSTSKTIRSNRQPYVIHVPKYGDKNQSIDDQCKVNATLTNNNTIVQEKELVVDEIKEVKEKEQIETVNIEKTNVSNDTDLPKTHDKLLDVLIVKPREFEIVRNKTNVKLKKNDQKNYDEEIYDNANKTVLPDSIKDKGQQDKLIDVPTEESNISLEKTKDEIKCEKENKLDEKETVKIVEKEKDKSIETKQEVATIKQDGETQPNIHPFLDAIQNNRYINSALDTTSAPILKEVEETKNNVCEADVEIKNEVEILNKSATHGSGNEVDITQDNDENAEIIIKNNNFEEFMEVTPPRAPISYHTVGPQNSIAPAFYRNYYQTPRNYQPRSQFDMNSNYYSPNNQNAPDEQRTVQINGSTAVSYNNYFKLPSYSRPNNRNDYPFNNRYYGYPTSQNRDWRHGSGYWQINGNTNERIWRSWKNTEYYLKSKNALKKIDSEQLNNLINQNSFTDKAKFMQRNAVNGNYKNQNNSPHL